MLFLDCKKILDKKNSLVKNRSWKAREALTPVRMGRTGNEKREVLMVVIIERDVNARGNGVEWLALFADPQGGYAQWAGSLGPLTQLAASRHAKRTVTVPDNVTVIFCRRDISHFRKAGPCEFYLGQPDGDEYMPGPKLTWTSAGLRAPDGRVWKIGQEPIRPIA